MGLKTLWCPPDVELLAELTFFPRGWNVLFTGWVLPVLENLGAEQVRPGVKTLAAAPFSTTENTRFLDIHFHEVLLTETRSLPHC